MRLYPVNLPLKSSLQSPETGLEFNPASVEKTLVPPRATSRDWTPPALFSNVISHVHWPKPSGAALAGDTETISIALSLDNADWIKGIFELYLG